MRVARTFAAFLSGTCLVGTADGAAIQSGSEERIAVIVGANVGSGDDEPLRFAEADARRFRDLMIELGDVRPERAILVTGGGPDQVLHAFIEARARAAEIRQTGRRVAFFFFYSGHGDDDSLHLPRGQLALASLRGQIVAVPADLRVTVLDACRGGAGRAKGVRRGPAFALAVSPEGPRGAIELRASSLGEAAQESEELGGAVFTHFLLSGLRGAADVDRDGRVTLAELYSYAYRKTLMRTGGGPALQHPALGVEMSGTGEVIVTRPAAAAASLEVPGGADRYLVFALPSAAVIGELSGERANHLALPVGQFLIARRAGDAHSVAMVDLPWGGRRTLTDRDFRPIAREELLAKGGRIEMRPWRVEGRAGVEFAPRGAEEAAIHLGLAAIYTHGTVEFALEGAFVGGDLATKGFDGSERSVAGGPALRFRTFWGRLMAIASVGAEIRYSWQHLMRAEEARLRAAGISTSEDRATGSIGPRIGVHAAVPLGRGFSAVGSVSSALLFGRAARSSNLSWHPVVSTTMGLGYAF